MAVRIPWEKYEAALLLNYCVKVEQKEISRKEAISTVSQILRHRATCAGLEIDDVFRNENGIAMQFSSMRNCYLGKYHGLTISKLFYEIVEIQKNNPEEFQKILQEEAGKMELSTWQEFLRWLRATHPKQERKTLNSLVKVNALGRKNRIMKIPLGDICDPEEVYRIMKIVTNPSQGFQSKKNATDACHALHLYAKFLQEEKASSLDKEDTEDQPTKNKCIQPTWEARYTEEVTQILSAKYKYGFRLGSAIELMKIRNYAEAENLALPESDEDLEREIIEAGISINEKVYVFSKDLLDKIGGMVDDIFHAGVTVIFLSTFIEKNEEWLEENHIASESLLRDILKRCKPSLYFGQNIITNGKRITEHNAVVAEIHRIAGEKAIIYSNDLATQLVYIPYEKIVWSLSASDEFVRISEGKYFRMCCFTCDETDADEILSFVLEECNSKGYASITDVPLDRISEENYELSTSALYSAIYIAILKEHFHINGKILTADQSGVDITSLLKDYCQNRDECSISEMMARAKELTGSNNKQYSVIALYNTMVRIDVDRFVSEKHVHFDVDQIDSLLEKIIGDSFAPVRKISTFALFPTCGFTWNHYLLESYCYRFSRKYRLSVLNYNDKNVGIIAAVSLPHSYHDMLCEAAANADIELTTEAVGEYLFINGFTTRRKSSTMPSIIEKAKTIREKR